VRVPVSRSRSQKTAADGVVLGLVPSLAEIPAAEWDALVDDNDPFLEHRFLRALERSGSVGGRSGWVPSYLVARQQGDGDGDGALLAAVPLFVKFHSYGEFIFDWGWASSAARAGIDYYPKLVAAAPFTPVTGQRLLSRRDGDPAARAALEDALCRGLRWAAEQLNASSVHVLFCTEAERARLAEHGFSPRLGLQFHWQNRTPPAPPYRDFDDFLSAFRSRNRKQVRHERTAAAGHGLRLATLTGPQLGDVEWAALEAFYEANIDKHDGARYLTPGFFTELRTHLADRVVATFAYDGDQPVAGTLNFQRGQHLYGRYWGTLVEREMLHFELCYYRLIEFAVQHGQTRFEAGAQGEHKLKRGLEPAGTYSAHFIRHPGLAAAVDRFVKAEELSVREELARYRELSPYARAGTSAAP
jgi:predicted N-acyltransferase